MGANYKVTIRNLVYKIRKIRPTAPEHLEDAGIALISLDAGCFREAFAISGRRLVIKFNIDSKYKWHARREIMRAAEILRKKSLRHLRRYVPKFYYFDYKNGVVIMEQLKVGGVPDKVAELLEKVLTDTFNKKYGADAGGDNLGYNGRGQIKLLDLGGL